MACPVGLARPDTFAVMAILIVLLAAVAIRQTPTDIFPEIDIPIVTVIWTYSGMATDEVEKRITTLSASTPSAATSTISAALNRRRSTAWR